MDRLRASFLNPLWRAFWRLQQPDVRIVTGGIAFYALFSIFPLIYLTLTFVGLMMPPDLAARLAQPISDILSQGVEPLSGEEIATISALTPRGFSFTALVALLLVLFTAVSGAKAAITGIRMIAGSTRPNRLVLFNGVSILMTGVLILSIWLLGLAQLIVSGVETTEFGFASGFAGEIAALADTLWITKWIGSFLVFYVIISLSLRGHVSGGRAKLIGAALGALSWLAVTFAFQLYLKYSVLDTLYGALASVIIGFLWLNVSVSCLLFGAASAVEFAQVFAEDEDTASAT